MPPRAAVRLLLRVVPWPRLLKEAASARVGTAVAGTVQQEQVCSGPPAAAEEAGEEEVEEEEKREAETEKEEEEEEGSATAEERAALVEMGSPLAQVGRWTKERGSEAFTVEHVIILRQMMN